MLIALNIVLVIVEFFHLIPSSSTKVLHRRMDRFPDDYRVYKFHDGRERIVHDAARPIVKEIERAALEAAEASEDTRWTTGYRHQETESRTTKKVEENPRGRNSK
ncbi:hypothetical protein PGT21_020819 [Puccinia graminis f. sp. tritici]|uniref:Uncharacterized protein n=2 Tax=Puccinia graminis f. sp. tritici TaxID=56615 RepID=A0A5B0NT42_PUCGR|nr:hypothetical protein PGT21_020819 [Puccinia graminis f. sp. tritici]